MLVRWLFAAVHLLALGIGLGSIWARNRELHALPGNDVLRRVFYADNLWGLAAGLWIVTGLVRAFGGLEKGTAYYLGHPFFQAKMGVLLVILGLEVAPMVALIRWRILLRHGKPVDTSKAGVYARISAVQGVLVVIMVGLAAALARGFRP